MDWEIHLRRQTLSTNVQARARAKLEASQNFSREKSDETKIERDTQMQKVAVVKNLPL